MTKLTYKLDFPGNLCRAAFGILAMFKGQRKSSLNVSFVSGSYLILSWCYDSKKIAESSLDMVGFRTLKGARGF